MWILNSEQMKKADRITIEELNIPGLILMENAGIAVVNVIEDLFEDMLDLQFTIVCGRGNNGGDGFVVARHLIRKGVNVDVILIGHHEQLKGDALTNYNMLRVYTNRIHEVRDRAEFDLFLEMLEKADVIIDALFGTGLTNPLSGLFAEIVETMNQQEGIIISIDIPSGLSSDTNKIIGPSINADITITLAAPKLCHIFPPAELFCGELFVEDIGIQDSVIIQANPSLKLITDEDIIPLLIPRMPDTHKSHYGEMLVVAGSSGKLGAAWMTGQSALRSGAGLVTIGVPHSCHKTMMSKVVELMTVGLACTPEGTFANAAVPEILDFVKDKHLIAVGPGITTHPECVELIRELISQYDKIMVIDADGINAIAQDISILNDKKGTLILTPHPGEMARLLKVSTKEIQDNRIEASRDFAVKHDIILVLKGYRTLVAFPNEMVYVNPTGNPGMASGGTGDVLTGMIAGFVAQNIDNINQAVLAGVYLHGLAGDIAKEKIGELPLTASDIMKYIPRAIKTIMNND
ncbi:MAG: hypothetical protein A2Y62_18210 [Candidatus Fischerbacteria bacterium RBG_13_37_8]|uniref:Bifunctional NAD(P)H-hydrate repair enzyme n=1 Tax=Candidatus Fischerbacteria bacterium RBG_13_37_8 TaxID=1817863 RepID=A0A1F5VVE9_9BACT|nr:MAG: hypothetical protein A2Y62_18210 [Candidatus Fischerbacteria bacterium RBG_13_37_8]